MLGHPLLRRAAALAAPICIVALAVLSLLPKEEMVRTGVDGRAEHFVAYAGTMTMCAVGWRGRFALARMAVGLVAYAGLLELGQHVSPGRTPAWLDFTAGAAGTLLALVAWGRLLKPAPTRDHTSSP